MAIIYNYQNDCYQHDNKNQAFKRSVIFEWNYAGVRGINEDVSK